MELNPENFDVIDVAAVLRHPDCDPHVRDIVLMLNERGGSITLAEMADLVGSDVSIIALGIVSTMIFAEIRRINDLEAAKRRGCN